ncbi:threonine synthase [Propionicicella superfundia]|uniref:threonine synthase n=1 Tax=Propionicicella superfundia TaxID=348582 RepID=UPI000411EE80|nr:threonine synthase [Propionicicella superfundia]
MRYVSTRGAAGDVPVGFCDILLEGLAPDGGLYVPESYPQVSAGTLEEWRGVLATQGYAELAFRVLSLFIDDIPAADLQAICARAYAAEAFGSRLVVPATPLAGRLWLLHLSNGPTAAFKDVAMQLLGELFAYELARRGSTLNILGATSGDTGSAAEYAMRGKPGVTVFMLTPAGRMSAFQQAQMFSIDDPHIVNIAVDGVFDDCQDLVKDLAGDLAFKRRWRLGAVNSINLARLLAQVVYYVAGWLQATSGPGQPVSFAVPSGNFGNICAGHVARRMGVPIDTLILATNENNVLHEFFSTGVYQVRGAADTYATSSPSMDISKASNFERFVFDLLGRDGARVRDLFGSPEFAATGRFDLSGTPGFAGLRERFGIVSGTSAHADRVATIARVHAETGVTIDPHTADAVKVATDLIEGVAEPVLVHETALPVKFAATIREALGHAPEVPAVFAGIEGLPRHVVDLPDDAAVLKEFIATRLTALAAG